MFTHAPPESSTWHDDMKPSGLKLNGYFAAAAGSANLRKRTMVRKFLCDQMLRVREKTPASALSHNKSLTLDGLLRHDIPSKSYSCKSLTTMKSASSVALKPPLSKSPQYDPRVVAIEGMSRHTSPSALVAAISGGALEKIVFRQEKTPFLEVYFLAGESAEKFYRSSQQCDLNVHGRQLRVTWPVGRSKSVPLASYIRHEIEQWGASRVVILSKPIFNKRKDNGPKRRYPDAAVNFSSEFNVEAIKWDFVQFGGIVEVCPVISSKLSVSIQFTDIRSAILAVTTLRSKTSLLYLKYRNWHHKYDRDVTNRPVIK